MSGLVVSPWLESWEGLFPTMVPAASLRSTWHTLHRPSGSNSQSPDRRDVSIPTSRQLRAHHPPPSCGPPPNSQIGVPVSPQPPHRRLDGSWWSCPRTTVNKHCTADPCADVSNHAHVPRPINCSRGIDFLFCLRYIILRSCRSNFLSEIGKYTAERSFCQILENLYALNSLAKWGKLKENYSKCEG